MARYGLLTIVMALILAGCGSGTQTGAPAVVAPTAAMMEKPTAAPAVVAPTAAMMEKPTGEAMMEKPTAAPTTEEPTAAPAAADRPAWQQIALVDARTGSSFTLADFAGRPVYVEPMATWCSNCRAQLVNVQQAIGALSADPPVFVALSVETDLNPADLAAYAANNNFDMMFAVASPELLMALTEVFGRTITNPPSTPHFIIRPNGATTELMTGLHPADELVQQLTAARSAG